MPGRRDAVPAQPNKELAHNSLLPAFFPPSLPPSLTLSVSRKLPTPTDFIAKFYQKLTCTYPSDVTECNV